MQHALRQPMKLYHEQATENLQSAYRLLWQAADQIEPSQWEEEVFPAIQDINKVIHRISKLNS